MSNEKQEVIDMFATKYGSENSKSQDILKNSISRLLSKKQMNLGTLQQLRNSLSRSQTEQAFFPKIEESRESSRVIKKAEPTIQNTTLRQSGQQFTKRLIPFQKTFLNQQSERISEASEESKKSIYLVDRHDEDEWAALIKFDAQLFQKEQQQKKELAQMKKKKLKEELDKQLKRKEEQKKMEKEGENNYHKFQTNLLEQQLEREKQKISQDKKRIKQLQAERDRQVKVLKKQKINEDRDNKIYKQQLNQRYETDYKQEQDTAQNTKQQKKDYMFRVMKQSELDKQSILDKEKDLQKQEFEQLNKYGQFLDQIEQKRFEAQKVRWDKVNKNTAWSEAQVAKYKQIEEDDYQFKQYKQLEEKRIQEELQQKKQKQNQTKIKTIQALEQQIEIKQQKTQQEKQLDQAQGRFWKEDTEKYLQDEQEKQRKIREAHIYHKYQLEQQIQDKKKPERGDKMTVLELMQNKKQLKTIKEQDVYEIEKIVV